MHLTTPSSEELNHAIEQFSARLTIEFKDVVFYMIGDRSIGIDSFSDSQPESTTDSHARAAIARSKQVLQELKELSPEFNRLATALQEKYFFCSQYGRGAFRLATEQNGHFTWLDTTIFAP